MRAPGLSLPWPRSAGRQARVSAPRWGAVVAGVAVLAALPSLAGRLPTRGTDLPAAQLLARITGSAQVSYSGYAEAVGGLRLPLTDEFTGLVDLFGDRTRLRVWWRGAADWRVDTVDATGETDRHQDATGVWTWDYESGRVVRSGQAPVRLPVGADLEPAQLARRLLSEAAPTEVERLPAARVAGRSAPGLRLRPTDPHTTITHVDVWADATTGVPLRVAVYGAGADRPVLDTAYLDFSLRRPDAETTAFTPPPGDRVSIERSDDLATQIDRFAPYQPLDRLAGYPLRQRVDGLGGIGTYGTGVTALVALPVPGQVSRPLEQQLDKTPGLQKVSNGRLLTVGPLSLLLVEGSNGRPHWLFTGTVTAATLQQAAAELAADPPALRLTP